MDRRTKDCANGIFLMLLSLLTSCSSTYQITGNSDITSLDGKTLSLRTLKNGQWIEMDSAEVVHGAFSMNGKADTATVVTLYFDNEGIMPIILENGDINVSISTQALQAKGTPLNDALYDFINMRNAMERQMDILSARRAQLIMEGGNANIARQQVQEEMQMLNSEMNMFVRSFISDNYTNILGPIVFSMMCNTLPYPIMTEEIEAILNNAPDSFLNQEWVKDFIVRARENMQFLDENFRMTTPEEDSLIPLRPQTTPHW